MDEPLSWGTHISEVSGKVAKVPAVLRRLKPLCPGGFSLPQFTNHWVCLILIIVVLSGEILNRAAPTITGTGWDVRSPQILCDYLHDEPRRQENKPIKNINVQNSEQAKYPNIYPINFPKPVPSIHRHNLRIWQHNLFVPRPYIEFLV